MTHRRCLRTEPFSPVFTLFVANDRRSSPPSHEKSPSRSNNPSTRQNLSRSGVSVGVLTHDLTAGDRSQAPRAPRVRYSDPVRFGRRRQNGVGVPNPWRPRDFWLCSNPPLFRKLARMGSPEARPALHSYPPISCTTARTVKACTTGRTLLDIASTFIGHVCHDHGQELCGRAGKTDLFKLRSSQTSGSY
jgi:hypothetical protein